ncbi:MAG: hypothetical protein RL675_296 [Bacteroidota bacterium]
MNTRNVSMIGIKTAANANAPVSVMFKSTKLELLARINLTDKTAKTKPRNKDPVSPIKTLAGEKL